MICTRAFFKVHYLSCEMCPVQVPVPCCTFTIVTESMEGKSAESKELWSSLVWWC
jgi:hypothetical protein